MPVRFAINRTCAPHLSLDAFLALARTAGVDAVEIRNDVPGQEFMDGTPASELRDRLAHAGLAAASINALQRFNDWTPEREAEARVLVAYAAEMGAPGLVMCPVIDEAHGWTGAEFGSKLRVALRGLRPIFADHGVTGYVEPLGMRGSTLTRQAEATEAVADVGAWDVFALCHDTFQYFRCGDDKAFPERVGLVHVSGIARGDLAPGDLTEPDRGFVFPGDRVGNLDQVRALIAAGYEGFVSMEPFSPETQRDPDMGRKLGASLDHLSEGLGLGQVVTGTA